MIAAEAMLRGTRSRSLRIAARFALWIWVAPWAWAAGAAQAPAGAMAIRPATPPMPPSGTPIDFFRELLAARPEEREKLLADKSPAHRKVLEKSLRDYEGVRPEERELRLRKMELRYRLTTLLRTPATNRAARLQQIPDRDRGIVEERLRLWDECSPQEQKAMLDNERIMRIWETVGPPPRLRLPVSGQTSNQLHQVEVEIIRWQSVPEERRERVQKIFGELFALSEEKPKRPLPPIPLRHAELRSIQQSLHQFRNLAPLQRDQCIRNFTKFADLTPAERRQFLASAQEWQRMAPEDRESWRKLVSRMPPLPPRIGPPLPPRPAASQAVAEAGTNSP